MFLVQDDGDDDVRTFESEVYSLNKSDEGSVVGVDWKKSYYSTYNFTVIKTSDQSRIKCAVTHQYFTD
jgi:hypothetical protein